MLTLWGLFATGRISVAANVNDPALNGECHFTVCVLSNSLSSLRKTRIKVVDASTVEVSAMQPPHVPALATAMPVASFGGWFEKNVLQSA